MVAVRKRAKACQSTEHLGGYFIALGLSEDIDAGSFIEDRMREFQGDSIPGQAMVALAFLDHPGANKLGITLLRSKKLSLSTRSQVALSLARIGDADTAQEVAKVLAASHDPKMRSTLTRALGRIGDRGPIEPLIATLANPALAMESRTGAATALGFICAKEITPWMTIITKGANYRTSTTSFKGQPQLVFGN